MQCDVTYHGVQHFKVIVFIIDSIATSKGATLTEETKVLGGLVANEEFLSLSSRRALEKLIENMVVPLSRRGVNETDLL
jgi:hypothetical protein